MNVIAADEAKSSGSRQRRDLDGVLLLDKPQGITSNAALRAAQRLYRASKAGHTGTLDPLATGLLPVCFGEASKFSHVLLDAEKTYLARLRLGVTTTTGDLEGEVTVRAPVSVTRHDVEAVLPRFVGEIMQVPPMYSAIKVNGQPLYKLARAGVDLPRMPRHVRVRELALLAIAGEDLELMVACSKGTYIRVLAEDIGRQLGCGACVSALRRTAVGRFTLGDGAVTLAQLEALAPQQLDGFLLPPDALVATLPRCDLDADQAHRITRGQALEHMQALPSGLTRIYGPDRRFLGVAEVTGMGRVVPRRLRSQEAAA